MKLIKDNRSFDEKQMFRWIKDLFFYCRSITGNGNKLTINYIQKEINNFKTVSFKTGKKVFDWKIPQEWNINDAYIQDENGKKYAEFKKNNLHILNYSVPVNKWINKEKLLENIYTEDKDPNRIPYVTSYYHKRWGYCMSKKEKNSISRNKSKKFKIYIDSNHSNGKLDLIHSLKKGKSRKEIFFSTYMCHPSMANDNLSGIAVLMNLNKYLNENYKKTKFSYRFVILPETIGSLAYLSKYKKHLKKNVLAGFNLTCLGATNRFSHIFSNTHDCLSDQALSAALIKKKDVKKYTFIEGRGSDERQYCSPGIDLPVTTFCKTRFGEFNEYHTDADNLKYIKPRFLYDSFEVIKQIIDSFETSLYPKTLNLGEPHLSKYGLVSSIGKKNYKKGRIYKSILLLANKKRNIFEISKILSLPLDQVNESISILKKFKLLE